jgi:hypothetical protein
MPLNLVAVAKKRYLVDKICRNKTFYFDERKPVKTPPLIFFRAPYKCAELFVSTTIDIFLDGPKAIF